MSFFSILISKSLIYEQKHLPTFVLTETKRPLPRRGIGNQNDNLKPESENYATTGFQDEAQTRL
jgi:hypothetical protein